MYKILYWVAGILVAALLVVGMFILLQIKNSPPPQANTAIPAQTTTSQPGAPTTSTTSTAPPANTFTVTGQNGVSIAVKDFLHNGETVPDTVNPGYYYLAGSIGYCLANGQCPSGYKTDNFTVTYNSATEQFSVALLTEPLSASREDAEEFLMDRLGLHRIELCNLNYYVSVSSSVDSKYAGMNLGFNVCPGAIILP